MPADFLDEVGFARDIDAERRHRHAPAVRVSTGRDAEPERLEDAYDVSRRHVLAEQARDSRRAQPDDGLRPGRRVAIDHRSERPPGANRLEERGSACDPEWRRGDVAAALEAHRRFGLQAQPLARAPDRRRVKVRALERDARRRWPDLGVVTAHHAADGARALGVGDDEHVRLERALDAVERLHSLARPGAADDDRSSGQAFEIEGVHRLPELEHT